MQPSEFWLWLYSYRGEDGGRGGHVDRVSGEGRDLLEHQDRPRGRDLERADGRWGGEVELQHGGGACQVDNEDFFHLLISIFICQVDNNLFFQLLIFIFICQVDNIFLFANFLFYLSGWQQGWKGRCPASTQDWTSRCFSKNVQVILTSLSVMVTSGNIDQVVRNVTSIPYHKDYE